MNQYELLISKMVKYKAPDHSAEVDQPI